MGLRIAIIDDEKHAGETLEWQLKNAKIPCEILGIFNDPVLALDIINDIKPNLLFLDIEMPGLNGFQFLDRLNVPDVQVVFTTAYNKFAVKAFRVNAIDYLMKPIDQTELQAALYKAEREKTRVDMDKLKMLFDGFKQANESHRKIALPSIHGVDFINTDRIIYCQSDSNYTRIFMVEGQKLIVSKTLKEIEMMLPEGVFFRIHNSFVANLQRVNKLLKSGGCSLLMENGVEIPVSRQRKDALLEKLSIH